MEITNKTLQQKKDTQKHFVVHVTHHVLYV